MTSENEDSTSQTGRRNGFSVGETSTEGVIDPTRPETKRWVDDTPTGDTLVEPSHPDSQLARLIDDLYVWTHAWSSPTAASDYDALKALEQAMGFVARRGSDLVGGAILHHSWYYGDEGAYLLSSAGVRDPDMPKAIHITRQLVAHCLITVGRPIQVEVNTGNRYLHQVVYEIPGADLFEDLVDLVGP